MGLQGWRGKQLSARAAIASQAGIDRTMAACVTHAKAHHDWENRTGLLEGSLRIAEPAHQEGPVVQGTWGSVAVMYAIFLEFLIGELMGDTGWTRHRAGGSPYLRPAADAEYPLLAARVKAAYGGREMP